MVIHDYLRTNAVRFPDKVALVSDNQRMTYRQIDEASDDFARMLVHIGCNKQDRVIVNTGNTIETIIAVYGILKAGCIFVVVDPTQKSKKLSYILSDTGATTIVSEARKFKIVKDAIVASSVSNVVWCSGAENRSGMPSFENENFKVQDLYWNWTSQTAFRINDIKLPDVIDVDLACLFYTSGSTGVPKGIITAHYNAEAVMKSLTAIFENDENDIIMNALPLFFDYGLYQVFMTFMCGGTVILEKSFLYPYRIAEKMVSEEATAFPFVPTMAALLFQIEDIHQFDFSAIRYITSSTAALPTDYIQRLKKIFPSARIFSRYGLSESVTATYLPPELIDTKPASVGIPIPNTEAFIVDKWGHKVQNGEIGELVVRGNIVMQGYWNAPERSKKTFRRGRYKAETLLYTGDLFRRDNDGHLYFVGRKDDLIKSGGERVSPKEIENVLCEMEGILEAAVVGVPDEILGSAVKAFVVTEDNGMLNEQKIRKYCTTSLQSSMIPKYIEIRDHLPKTSYGKIDKKRISEE